MADCGIDIKVEPEDNENSASCDKACLDIKEEREENAGVNDYDEWATDPIKIEPEISLEEAAPFERSSLSNRCGSAELESRYDDYERKSATRREVKLTKRRKLASHKEHNRTAGSEKTESSNRMNAGPRFECKICLRTYSSKTILVRHMIQHRSGKGYLCPLCGRSFGRLLSLFSHRPTHTPAARRGQAKMPRRSLQAEKQADRGECGKSIGRPNMKVEHRELISDHQLNIGTRNSSK